MENKKNFNSTIIKIDNFIQKPIGENTKEKLYNKPNHIWCLNSEVKLIAESFSKELLEIINQNNEKRINKKINYIDLFSGGTVLSLNVLNCLDLSIFNKIILNDIAYKQTEIINQIKINNPKIEYWNLDLSIINNEFTDSFDFDNLLSQIDAKNSINIFVFNPLVLGKKEKSVFHIEYISKLFSVLKTKYTNKFNHDGKEFDNNILILFSTLEYDGDKLKKNKESIDLFDKEKKIIIIKNIKSDLNEDEKQRLKIKRIFDENNDSYLETTKKIDTIYNIFIYNGLSNEKRIHYKYFNGDLIMNEEDFEKFKEQKHTQLSLDDISFSKIIEKYESFKKDI